MDIRPTTKSKNSEVTKVPKKSSPLKPLEIEADDEASADALRSRPELVIEPIASSGAENKPDTTEKSQSKSEIKIETPTVVEEEDTDTPVIDTKEDLPTIDPTTNTADKPSEALSTDTTEIGEVAVSVKSQSVAEGTAAEQKSESSATPVVSTQTDEAVQQSEPESASDQKQTLTKSAPVQPETESDTDSSAPDTQGAAKVDTPAVAGSEASPDTTIEEAAITEDGAPQLKPEADGIVLPTKNYKLPISKAPRKRHKTLKAAGQKNSVQKQTTVVDLTKAVPGKPVKLKRAHAQHPGKVKKILLILLLLLLLLGIGGWYVYEYRVRPQLAVGNYYESLMTANSATYSAELTQQGLFSVVPAKIAVEGRYLRSDEDISANLRLSDANLAALLETQLGTDAELIFGDGDLYVPTAIFFGSEQSAELPEWLQFSLLQAGGFDSACSEEERELVGQKIAQLHKVKSPLLQTRRTDSVVDVVLQKQPHYSGTLDLARLAEMSLQIVEFADETCWNNEFSRAYPEAITAAQRYVSDLGELTTDFTYTKVADTHTARFNIKFPDVAKVLVFTLSHSAGEVEQIALPADFQEADPALIASTLFAEPEPLLDESSAQAVEQTSEQKDAEITAELLVIAEALEAYVEQNGSLPDQSLFSEPDQAAATLQLKVEQLTYPGGDVLNASDDNSRAYQLLYTEEGNGFIVSALASDGSTVLSETR